MDAIFVSPRLCAACGFALAWTLGVSSRPRLRWLGYRPLEPFAAMGDIMRQGSRWIVGLLFGAGLWLWAAVPAEAVITRLTPLADFLEESLVIVVAKVETLDKDRPSMMLVVDEVLKGKPAQKKLPVLLKGDRAAIKRKEPPQLLKRLANKLPVVVFIRERKEDRAAFAYTNGTWFSLGGVKVDGEVRWSLSHLEPYLRRTYKGTTAEMAQTVRDALSGKRKPPGVDEKAKPGIGPELPSDKKSEAVAPFTPPSYAVIPTVLVGGPLAMLAMLFPAVFGGWKRWLVLLSTTATNSTLFTLQWWFFASLAGSWWGSPLTLWVAMTVVTVLGIAWAWSRHLARVQEGEAPALPGRAELIVLLAIAVLTTVGLGFARYILKFQLEWREWWPAVTFLGALWVGILYVIYARLLRGPRLRPAIATEAVVLTALVLLYTLVVPSLQPQGLAGGLEGGDSGVALVPIWTFRLPAKGAIASSPLVSGDRVYVAAAHDGAFRPYGAVYCLDRATGKVVWTFDDNGKMKQVFSSPVEVDGRLYIGEGFHQDSECRIFCLSADKGEKLWEFLTDSHTESTPAVVAGKLFCGAGDDGMFCLSAGKGEKLWQFSSFHIDASPVVVSDRVYAGCGIGDEHKTTALFCLDAKTGQPRWRVNTELPVWGRPVVTGDFVYAGTGNGRLNESDAHPAGAVLCLRAADGDEVWKRKLPDGVLGRLAADRRHLFFGCRDGHFYCLRRSDGAQVWRRKMGSAVVAGPALEAHPSGEAAAERVYAVGENGYLACMEPATGKLIWERALADRTKTGVEVIATPALEVRTEKDGSEVRRLYVGLTLKSSGGRLGELHCYEETTAMKE
jgi:outer membrane protein assembly factor BamB